MNSVEHTTNIQIDQPAEVLFPLFSPEGEKLWVPGWEYENISASPELHEDFIFTTKAHDHAQSDAIWLVKRYDPHAYLVEYYKIEPQQKVGVIQVQCQPLSQSKTIIQVTYEYIALSEAGEEFVKGFTSQVYEDFIAEWQQWLEVYFKQR
jgi:hypothetical protein